MSDAQTSVPGTSLRRTLGICDLVSVGTNMVVGSGIFVLTALIAQKVGVYGPQLFVTVGAGCTLVSLCFAELASRFERTGGPTAFTQEAFGLFPGFLVGWMMWFTTVSGMATVLNGLAASMAAFSPGFNSPEVQSRFMVCFALLLTAASARGTWVISALIRALTVAKLVPLVLFCAVGVFFVRSELLAPSPYPPLPSANSLAEGALLLVFAFGGFESVAIVAGEARNPKRDIPLALILSILAATCLYALLSLVTTGTLPAHAESTKPLTDAAMVFAGPLCAFGMSVGAAVAMAGVCAGCILSAPRTLLALSESPDSGLPSWFGWIHPKWQTPVNAIVFSAAATLLLALSGSFAHLAGVGALSRLFMQGTCCLAVIALRRQDALKLAEKDGLEKARVLGELERFRLPLGPLIPLLGVALITVCAIAGAKQRQVLVAGAAMACGVLFYSAKRGLDFLPTMSFKRMTHRSKRTLMLLVCIAAAGIAPLFFLHHKPLHLSHQYLAALAESREMREAAKEVYGVHAAKEVQEVRAAKELQAAMDAQEVKDAHPAKEIRAAKEVHAAKEVRDPPSQSVSPRTPPPRVSSSEPAQTVFPPLRRILTSRRITEEQQRGSSCLNISFANTDTSILYPVLEFYETFWDQSGAGLLTPNLITNATQHPDLDHPSVDLYDSCRHSKDTWHHGVKVPDPNLLPHQYSKYTRLDMWRPDAHTGIGLKDNLCSVSTWVRTRMADEGVTTHCFFRASDFLAYLAGEQIEKTSTKSLKALAAAAQRLQKDLGKDARTWMVKSPLSSSGKGSAIYTTRQLLETMAKEETAATTAMATIQEYIGNPTTFAHRNARGDSVEVKMDLRIYGVVTSVEPLRVHVYRDGFFRTAHPDYNFTAGAESLGNSSIHFTNIDPQITAGVYVPHREDAPEEYSTTGSFAKFLSQAKRFGWSEEQFIRKIRELVARLFVGWRGMNKEALLTKCRADASCSRRGAEFFADVGVTKSGEVSMYEIHPSCAIKPFDKDSFFEAMERGKRVGGRFIYDVGLKHIAQRAQFGIMAMNAARFVDVWGWEARARELAAKVLRDAGDTDVSQTELDDIAVALKEWYLGSVHNIEMAVPASLHLDADQPEAYPELRSQLSAADKKHEARLRAILPALRQALAASGTEAGDRATWRPFDIVPSTMMK